MVADQIRARGVSDEAVLRAMEAVPREVFVGIEGAGRAYEDAPQPILEGQTISQPYVVAYMIEALAPALGQRVLEVGTGSGYAAAVLSRVVSQVYTVERYPSLGRLARWRLHRLGYRNVVVRTGDGTLGWAEHAPYDGILVSAGAPEVPEALRLQLAVGGRLVIPVGTRRARQELLCVHRTGPSEWREENLGEVRFVPLVGKAGWQEPEQPEQA
jgi:protein-L-isoaspartate(D-aspartate) O-methyltransferase